MSISAYMIEAVLSVNFAPSTIYPKEPSGYFENNVDVFDGYPAEGAALLLGDAQRTDDFGTQHAVLRRMDADEAFRVRLIELVSRHDTTERT